MVKDLPEDFGTATSRTLCQQIAEESDGVCLLAFSRGKDSIAAWLQLRRFFTKVIPFHMAMVPGLPFEEASLQYFEQEFATPIYRCTSHLFWNMMGSRVFQSPAHNEALDHFQGGEQFDHYDVMEEIRTREHCPLAWCAWAVSLTDSIQRRTYMQDQDGRQAKGSVFYPCYDWSSASIIDAIKLSGVKLPIDYTMHRRSFRQLSVKYFQPMRETLPADYAQIRTWFPLADAEIWRQVYRKNYHENYAKSHGKKLTVAQVHAKYAELQKTADAAKELPSGDIVFSSGEGS